MKKKLFEPKVVQFFHSGSEFPQKKIDETHKHKPWSVNSHTRNFIKCKGEYVDKSGRKNKEHWCSGENGRLKQMLL